MDDNLTIPGIRKADINEEKIISRIQKADKKNYKRAAKFKEIKEEPVADIFDSKQNDSVIVFSKNFTDNTESTDENGYVKNLKEEEDYKPMLFFGTNNYNEENFDEVNEDNSIFSTDEEQSDADRGFFNKSVKQEVTDWIKHILIAVVVGLLLVVFVVQRNEVVGSSMEPNLMNQDQLLVQKITKLFDSGIKYGDIITIDAKGLPYHNGDNNIIKRVLGLPGDFIEIKDGYVYRNGQRVDENYLDNVDTSERKPEYSSIMLGDDEFYILGDNRPVSLDSRTFGPVERSRIVGEVLIRFYPLDHFGKP